MSALVDEVSSVQDEQQQQPQEGISSASIPGTTVSAPVEAPEASTIPQPFPRPRTQAQLLSPTPSTTSPYPAAEASVTGSAATSPQVSSLPPESVLGREDNSAARAALARGPPDLRIHPEDSRNGGLVHGTFCYMRLQSANMLQELSDFHGLMLQVWTGDEIKQMIAYLAQSDAAMPTANELERHWRALRVPQRQRETENRDGGLVHATMTVIRLNGAQKPQIAREIRQLAAEIWMMERCRIWSHT